MSRLLLGLFLSIAFADAEAAQLTQGLRLAHAKRFDDAYTAFDSIAPETAAYPAAFAELQKIHYRRGEWSKFFGFAAFYRRRLIESYRNPDLLLLESLALTKHCHFDTAAKILDLARGMATNADSRARVEATAALLFLQSKLPGNVATEAVRKKPQAFASVNQWKVSGVRKQDTLDSAVRNPRALRVYVANACAAAPDEAAR